MKKNLTLVFNRAISNGFELHSIGVDGLFSFASDTRDSRTGQWFHWKPSSGIAALALFFVRAANMQRNAEAHILDSKRLPGLRGYLVWGGETDETGKICHNHPLSIIQGSLILNRKRASRYLYRLFYQEAFLESGVKFEDLGSPHFSDPAKFLRKLESKDHLPTALRQEFGLLIYLGCLIIKREPSGGRGRRFWTYFCSRPGMEWRINIKIRSALDGHFEEQIASPQEMEMVEKSLGSPFDLGKFPIALDDHRLIATQTHLDETTFPSRPIGRENQGKGSSYAKSHAGTALIAALCLVIGFLIHDVTTPHLPIPKPLVIPTGLTIEGQTLSVFNQAGRVMWMKSMDGNIELKNCLITDLDNDGSNEVVVSVLGYDSPKGGALSVFDHSGNELWTFQQNELPPFESEASGRFAIREMIVDHVISDERKQIILLMYDGHGREASCACLLNADGSLLWTYWHPGHITDAIVGSQSADHKRRILFAAINNDFADQIPGPFKDGPKSANPRTIFMLNPVPSEIAPPFEKGAIDSLGLLDWYGVISPEPLGVERLDIVDDDHDGTYHIVVWVSAAIAWHFDFDGNIIDEVKTAGIERPIQYVPIYPVNHLETIPASW